jgi:hypothetical protein
MTVRAFLIPKRALPALLALVAITAGCRIDMHIQPYYRTMAKSDFFGDERSARLPVEGTVARGDLHEDAYFYTGKIGSNPGGFMPTRALQYQLHALSRTRRRWWRIYSNAWIQASALVPHRAPAQGSDRLLF